MRFDALSIEAQLAWAAGFIEGEGCFYVKTSDRGERRHFSLRVSQSHPEPLQYLADLAGYGKVTGPYGPYGTGKKPVYQWYLHGPRAIAFFERLKPYLCQNKLEQGNLIKTLVLGDIAG